MSKNTLARRIAAGFLILGVFGGVTVSTTACNNTQPQQVQVDDDDDGDGDNNDSGHKMPHGKQRILR